MTHFFKRNYTALQTIYLIKKRSYEQGQVDRDKFVSDVQILVVKSLSPADKKERENSVSPL